MKSKYLSVLFLIFSVCFLPYSASASERGPQTPGEARNEEVVRKFYDAAINQKDFAAASQYLGDEYTQHNPNAGDGPEGLKNFLAHLRNNLPQYQSSIVSAFTDGDYVIVHVMNKPEPGSRGFAIIDIFRLTDGKIVEHWDVKQEIPEKMAHDNGMF